MATTGMAANIHRSQDDLDDFFMPEQLGFPAHSLYYVFDIATARALLSEKTAKLVVYHGDWSPKEKIYLSFELEEFVPIFVSAKSNFHNISKQQLEDIFEGNVTRQSKTLLSNAGFSFRLIAPSLPSRLVALEYALNKSGLGASANDFEAVSPFYNRIAEEVSEDPNALGFGIRGTAVKKLGLRVLKIEGLDPFEVSQTRAYPLKSRMLVITNRDYGDAGRHLFNTYVSLIEKRIQEDAYLFLKL
jgi:hypothetical protein